MLRKAPAMRSPTRSWKKNLIRINWLSLAVLFLLLFTAGYSLLLFPSWEKIPASSLDITYIANEGFLISSSKKKVLIDAVFTEGYGIYAVPAPELLERMRKAEAPFKDIDIILVTHADGDHFDPSSMVHYLKNNPNTTLICPQQAFRFMGEEAGFGQIKDQIEPIELECGATAELNCQGIPLKILRLKHSLDKSNMKQNLSFIVELEGKKFIHLGDAEEKIDNFEKYQWLKQEDIDVAFIPFWYLPDPDGRDIIKNLINPKHIFLMHISPGNLNDVFNRIRKHLNQFPNTLVFRKSMENQKIKFSPSIQRNNF